MNYEKIYDNLIQQAQTFQDDRLYQNVYLERHHIIPRSIGGSNHPSNLVYLTAKEHYVAHHLLWKAATLSPTRKKMLWAFAALCYLHNTNNQQRTKITARIFNYVRQQYSEARKGVRFTDSHKQKLSAAAKGRKRTPEQIELQRSKIKGVPKTEQHRNNMSLARRGSKNPMFGKKPWNVGIPVSEEHKLHLSNKNNHKKKKVIVDNVEYPSIREACRQTGLHQSTIYGRIHRKNKGYYYVQ